MGARKLRLKNRENPKIVFSARVSSLPLSVKHWFFFYIQAIFHIRSSMLQRRINSVKLRILTGNDFKCHRNKIAWFGSLCNSIKLEIFNCTRTQRIKRSSIDPIIITRKKKRSTFRRENCPKTIGEQYFFRVLLHLFVTASKGCTIVMMKYYSLCSRSFPLNVINLVEGAKRDKSRMDSSTWRTKSLYLSNFTAS